MKQLIQPSDFLRGMLHLPPDKSIAQRAALFSLLSEECSGISNYPEAGDPQTALKCVEKLGANVIKEGKNVSIRGVGRYGIMSPEEEVDCGNSGTVMRLLSGILTGAGIEATLTGDASLSQRPMKRIIDPLTRMGATIRSEKGGYPPLHFKRKGALHPLDFRLPVPSAQLKSCVLLAGLFGDAPTQVVETIASRNHTETMLDLPQKRNKGETVIISHKKLSIPPQILEIPGDFSAAAFWLVAASILEGSEIVMPVTGINPTRSAAMSVLRRMGANIELTQEYRSGGERVADLRVRSACLQPTEIQPREVPNAIDELPVLCVAMAFADGVSRIRGAGELRFKESDRLAAMELLLGNAGVRVEAQEEGLTIYGEPGRLLKPARHDSRHDHRIAMSAAIMSLKADGVSEIEHAEAAAVSYPEFWAHLATVSH